MAKRLAEVHGHHQLDWVLLLDPVATDTLPCWQSFARMLVAEQQGQMPLGMGQRLVSSGLSLTLLAQRGEPLLLTAGRLRWWVLPSPQALWSLQARGSNDLRRPMTGYWLGFQPSRSQRQWLECRKSALGSRSSVCGRQQAFGEVAESG